MPEVVVPQAEEAPRRKYLWLAAGASVGAIIVVLAVVLFGQEEPPAAAHIAAPAPAAVKAPAAAIPAPAAPAAPAANASPLAALEAEAQGSAAIVDEVPPPPDIKPKESLKHMLESGAAPAPKKDVAKSAPKAPKEKPAKPAGKAISSASPEEDNDAELLAALIAHTKYDASSNAPMTMPRALEMCKKQGARDAARCRIRVCEGRWKKDECRAFNRSKLERTANGA